MEQLFEYFLKSGLRPLSIFPETIELENKVNRSELAALIMLQFHNELTMSELAAKLGSPLSTMTSLAQRLERKKLIERKQSSKDQRIKLIRLTEDGQKIAKKVKKIIQEILARIQTALNPDELNQFLTLSIKVISALQENVEPKETSPNAALRKIVIDD